jgi:ribonuclease P protein component
LKNYGLSASERIKSRKEIEKVFDEGKKVYSSENNIRASYIIEKNSQLPGVRFAVAVPKKLGNAVWRNRVKRLIREGYRLNKKMLIEASISHKCNLRIILVPQNFNQTQYKNIFFRDIEPSVKEIIFKLQQKI